MAIGSMNGDPGDPRLALGQQLAGQQNFAAAYETLSELVAAQPGNLPARISLAHVAAHLGRFDEAERHFVATIDAAPNRADLRLSLGQLESHRGRRREAVARIREAIEIGRASCRERCRSRWS